MRTKWIATICLAAGGCVLMSAFQSEYPQAEISNGQIHAKLYLPDAKTGFYRGTRFDWSGVISSLEYGGHDYYGPWFTKQDATVRDFVYRDPDIVVSTESGSMGPADEFQTPLGFDAADAGGTFIKVGVGVLRRPDKTPYSAYKKYEIVDPGKWSTRKGKDFVEFTQQLNDPATGYGYLYRKTVRLISGLLPKMTIEHSLKNTGRQPIATNLYNHNFLTLDHSQTGNYVLRFRFEVKTSRLPNKDLAEVRGNEIVYLKTLQDRETVAMPVEGFGPTAKDYDITIENDKLGAGMSIVGDHPLQSMALWSIRSVMAIEPFISISVDPGKEMTWKYTYTYYELVNNDLPRG